jgi:hypothetical protein
VAASDSWTGYRKVVPRAPKLRNPKRALPIVIRAISPFGAVAKPCSREDYMRDPANQPGVPAALPIFAFNQRRSAITAGHAVDARQLSSFLECPRFAKRVSASR